ncbi:hypothetical protein B0T10DRAFT_91570 [Thelonectria olida]|uniref:Uncharacterized protein n=1 Tax=Thelonectria olida TaxID=1576542 RepID=A0A9P8W1T2_9HYPO|nr:hypothetical protein B0T10DRAFT_91570 [Thelonectria olida]
MPRGHPSSPAAQQPSSTPVVLIEARRRIGGPAPRRVHPQNLEPGRVTSIVPWKRIFSLSTTPIPPFSPLLFSSASRLHFSLPRPARFGVGDCAVTVVFHCIALRRTLNQPTPPPLALGDLPVTFTATTTTNCLTCPSIDTTTPSARIPINPWLLRTRPCFAPWHLLASPTPRASLQYILLLSLPFVRLPNCLLPPSKYNNIRHPSRLSPPLFYLRIRRLQHLP